MFDLGSLVVFENLVQTSISAAIGMEEQDHPVRAVQLDGFLDLFEKEDPVAFVVGGGQRFRAARHNDGIGVDDADPFQKFAENEVEAVVEASHDHGIAMILLGWGTEVEDAFHRELTPVIFAFAAERCQGKIALFDSADGAQGLG